MMNTTTTTTAKKKNWRRILTTISVHAFGAGGISLGGIGISRIAFSAREHLGGRAGGWTRTNTCAQTYWDICSGFDALYGLYEFVILSYWCGHVGRQPLGAII